MKVLHVVKTSKGARWAFEQANWLHNNGVEITTVLPDINEGYAEQYKNKGMRIIEGDFSLPIKNPSLIIDRIRLIRRIVEEESPDVIHTHFVTNIIMMRIALQKSKVPRLFQVPGPLHLENCIYKKAEILLSNKYDHWAASCKRTYDIYKDEGIDDNKNFIAYYGGYGGETCNLYKNPSGILHEEYDIPKDSILIGMVSYFYKPKKYLLQKRGIKGHEDFIDALKIVSRKYPNVKGIIIGGPWGDSHKYEEQIKTYANKQCDNVIFTGFRDDIKKIYRELDIAVHPSHSENLGGAAESLAAGIPTISTNIGGFTDIVINDETGYTVNKENPLELAEAIEKMILDNKKANIMANNGKELIYNMLDINKTSNKIKDIYYKIKE